MSIFGIGVDLVDVNRMKKLIKKKEFLNKVFAKEELNYCKKKINKFYCLSKRFAAKEAFSKSLGTGIAQGLKFKEILVVNNSLGKPIIKIKGNSKNIVNKILKKKNFDIFLSLSDEKTLAVAYVIIELK